MLITEQKLNHWLDNFYGYGSWQAQFWFIGYEEPGGDVPEEVADKFNYFFDAHQKNSPTLCDIREVYEHVRITPENPKAELFSNRFDYRFGEKAIESTIWKNLAAFVHSYNQKPEPDLFAYQKKHFAQPGAKREALIPLYPLPGSHTHSWHYNWLNLAGCDFLKSQDRYEEYVYSQRIQTILSKIKEHKPEVVLLYGMKNINGLKKSVQDFFENVQFTIGKGIKLQIPQHHRADLNGTTLIITTQIPALHHNRVETGFDWKQFGALIKAGR
ncbi:MAG: hypothetical protein KF775_02915 [Cyclobacteriaceae bacterium]|nr:hypothetical protein [Cyclobacteriaceae bacterium]